MAARKPAAPQAAPDKDEVPDKDDLELVELKPEDGVVTMYDARIRCGKGSYQIAGLYFFGDVTHQVDEETAQQLRMTEAFDLVPKHYKLKAKKAAASESDESA